MFTLSFKVSNSKLADTLIRLHEIVSDVQVIPDTETQPVLQANAAQATAVTKNPVKVKRHYRKAPSSGGTQEERAAQLITEYGVPSFTAAEYLKRAERAGINKAAAYRAIRSEMNAGRLSRPEPGLYQRTGSGFASSLNLKQA